jgi:hypothetical protein
MTTHQILATSTTTATVTANQSTTPTAVASALSLPVIVAGTKDNNLHHHHHINNNHHHINNHHHHHQQHYDNKHATSPHINSSNNHHTLSDHQLPSISLSAIIESYISSSPLSPITIDSNMITPPRSLTPLLFPSLQQQIYSLPEFSHVIPIAKLSSTTHASRATTTTGVSCHTLPPIIATIPKARYSI